MLCDKEYNFEIYIRIIKETWFSSIKCSHSVMSNSWWPRESQHASPLVYHQLPAFIQIDVQRLGDAIQPAHSLSSPSPPAPSPSQLQGLFQLVNSSYEVAKVWEFQLQYQSFQWTPRNDLFRMEWLDLLAVQGNLKSLCQHHSSKASIFWCSPFVTVQISHSYMTTGKTIAWTRWTFVGKVMSLLFNMLSSVVITFLPRSKGLLISWLQSPSVVILDPKR